MPKTLMVYKQNFKLIIYIIFLILKDSFTIGWYMNLVWNTINKK